MQFKIIKTDTNYILEQIEEIQKGSFAHKDIASLNGKCRHDTDMDGDCPYHKNGCPKLSEMTFTDEVAEVVGYVDIIKKCDEIYDMHPNNLDVYEDAESKNTYKAGVWDGYTQALNDNKDRVYTDKNILSAIYWGIHHWKARLENPTPEMINEFTKSLTTTSWNVEIEIEPITTYPIEGNTDVSVTHGAEGQKFMGLTPKPKVTNNTIKVISIKP